VRQFISGMAGTHNGGTTFGTIHPLSETRQNSTTGILKLTLDSTFYRWEFLAVPGRGDYSDSGRGECHGPRPMGTAQVLGRAGRRLLETVQDASQPVPLLWPDAHERAIRRSTSD